MTDNQVLPEPTDLVAAFVTAFNSGSAEAVDELYEDAAVLVPAPGQPMSGPARSAANRHLLDFGLPMEVAVQHVYVVGDLALLLVDWSIDGTTTAGIEIHLKATATDVARRGADGMWRYVIDNPFGVGR
ncbi:YybH family protein [Fodinicola feengrottensis]|uniref:SnoaL-like domain-containing protein n=1 Tax=Fodinicola feengrottensis TaxID=435914 RepID=A0ABN2HHX1_9ACTN|nr:nuclear transport factor 2 family protein [Fodinicola feengrottensis]